MRSLPSSVTHDDRDIGDVTTFKELMARFPSGVAVVTTLDGGGTPFGLTCSSLCSVSLDPPLMLVCIHNHSQTLLAIRACGSLAVNLLHEGGRETAELFASPVADRFAQVRWRPTPRLALPGLVADAHTVAECRVRDTTVAGDHTILLGDVVAITTVTAGRPLLYGLRRYAAWPAGT